MVYVIFSVHTGWCSPPMTWDEVLNSEYAGTGEQVAQIAATDIDTFAASVFQSAAGAGDVRLDLTKEDGV